MLMKKRPIPIFGGPLGGGNPFLDILG